MYIDYPEALKEDSFSERDIYDEMLSIDDELDRQVKVNAVRNQAKELKLTKVFDDMWKIAQKEHAKIQKRELANSLEQYGAMLTDFSLRDQEPGGQLNCGDWIADDDGVRLHTERGIQWACSHPIYMSKTLRNVENGKCKAEIVFKVAGSPTQRICVEKMMLATSAKIVELSNYGANVNALTAPYLIKYLSDLQTLNPTLISECPSTNRLGWVSSVNESGEAIKQFIPYQAEVVFDNTEMMHLFKALKPHGSQQTWYSLVKKIRKKQQPEVLLNMAASFASVLVEPCNALPFIVSLWGESGIGKTVILKLCASIWANPKEGKYITDPKATPIALEVRLDVLNSFPMIMDDIAQITMQSDTDFSKQIYNWCSGQGRERSKKDAESTRVLKHWCNVTITNGERSLVDETMQGGAINRVIDIEATGEKLFDAKEGNKTCETIEKNYGWAGEEFVRQLFYLGFDELNRIYNEQFNRVKEAAKNKGVEKEDKQIVPMALILTADYISEKYLFCDGIRINLEQAIDYLRNKGEASEVKNAYKDLMDQIFSNAHHFALSQTASLDSVNAEYWGCYLNDSNRRYVAIVPVKFRDLMGSPGLAKSFLSWARKKGVLITDNGPKNSKVIKIDGVTRRMIVLDTQFDENEENPLETVDSEDDYKDLPFK